MKSFVNILFVFSFITNVPSWAGTGEDFLVRHTGPIGRKPNRCELLLLNLALKLEILPDAHGEAPGYLIASSHSVAETHPWLKWKDDAFLPNGRPLNLVGKRGTVLVSKGMYGFMKADATSLGRHLQSLLNPEETYSEGLTIMTDREMSLDALIKRSNTLCSESPKCRIPAAPGIIYWALNYAKESGRIVEQSASGVTLMTSTGPKKFLFTDLDDSRKPLTQKMEYPGGWSLLEDIQDGWVVSPFFFTFIPSSRANL